MRSGYLQKEDNFLAKGGSFNSLSRYNFDRKRLTFDMDHEKSIR